MQWRPQWKYSSAGVFFPAGGHRRQAMKVLTVTLYVCGFMLLGTAPGSAMASWFPEHPGNGNHYGNGVSRSAPGPVIGVGIPALAALGGYIWYRRRQRGK